MVDVAYHLAMKLKKISKSGGEFSWADELLILETTMEYVDSTKIFKNFLYIYKTIFNSKFKIRYKKIILQ